MFFGVPRMPHSGNLVLCAFSLSFGSPLLLSIFIWDVQKDFISFVLIRGILHRICVLCSILLQLMDDPRLVALCLDGYRFAIRLAGLFRQTTERVWSNNVCGPCLLLLVVTIFHAWFHFFYFFFVIVFSRRHLLLVWRNSRCLGRRRLRKWNKKILMPSKFFSPLHSTPADQVACLFTDKWGSLPRSILSFSLTHFFSFLVSLPLCFLYFFLHLFILNICHASRPHTAAPRVIVWGRAGPWCSNAFPNSNDCIWSGKVPNQIPPFSRYCYVYLNPESTRWITLWLVSYW